MTTMDERTPVDEQLRQAATAIRTSRGEASFTVRPPGTTRSLSGPLLAVVVGLVLGLVIAVPLFLIGGSRSHAPGGDVGTGSGGSVPTTQASGAAPSGTLVTDTNPESPCPEQDDQVTTGTLYLGGPASDQNLAADGFLYSLPGGATPVEVATRMVRLAILGRDCGVSGLANADETGVAVTISPPAVPQELVLDVTVVERGGSIGVTGIGDPSELEIGHFTDAPSVRLAEGVPANTGLIDVRFKKGDDVWQLSLAPTSTEPIELSVPANETDRFPDADIDWVLIVFLTDDQLVLGAHGRFLP